MAANGDSLEMLTLESRIARAALGFRDEVEIPDEPGMTDSERSMQRIMRASGKAACDFMDEVIRLHHDPQNPLRIDPTAGGRLSEDSDLERWRNYNIAGLQTLAVREAREEYTREYGFPVVTGEAIEKIRKAVGDNPIVEIGAGNGWLARELCERGLTVHPTDPTSLEENEYGLGLTEHMPVEKLDGLEALDQYPDCDLLWSWPQMASYVPEVMKSFRGKHLIYIGENGYGCTGPREDIVVTMEGHYRETGWNPLPSFPSVNDNLYILERIDYKLEPPSRDPGKYQTSWGEHIQAQDLDRILEGEIDEDLAARIAEAAFRERRINQQTSETQEENLRQNMEFSIPHIARATVSDAMRYGSAGLREQLETELLETDTTEREWAEARILEIQQMAALPAEWVIQRELEENSE